MKKLAAKAKRKATGAASFAHRNAGAIALGWLLACAAGYDVKKVAAQYLGLPEAVASCCGVTKAGADALASKETRR